MSNKNRPGVALYGPGTPFRDRTAWLQAARSQEAEFNDLASRKGWRSRQHLTPGERCPDYQINCNAGESRSAYWDAEFAWHQSQN